MPIRMRERVVVRMDTNAIAAFRGTFLEDLICANYMITTIGNFRWQHVEDF
jgi:hypothetical protein